MSADRFDTKAIRDLNHHLARIATATERIADALDQMNANDPIAAIGKALEYTNSDVVTRHEDMPTPTLTKPETLHGENVTTVEYGAELPESEKWRLGS
jgi:hypothetical protein